MFVRIFVQPHEKRKWLSREERFAMKSCGSQTTYFALVLQNHKKIIEYNCKFMTLFELSGGLKLLVISADKVIKSL